MISSGVRLERERQELESRKRERDEQHLYLTTKVSRSRCFDSCGSLLIQSCREQVITDATFCQHQGFDLASFDDRNAPAPTIEIPSYRVLKSQTFLDFRAQIAQSHGYNPDDCRLWVLVNRQNKTVRPDAPVSDNDPTLSSLLFFPLLRLGTGCG